MAVGFDGEGFVIRVVAGEVLHAGVSRGVPYVAKKFDVRLDGGPKPAPQRPEMWDIPEEHRPLVRAHVEEGLKRRDAARAAAMESMPPEEAACLQTFLDGLDNGTRDAVLLVNDVARFAKLPQIAGPDTRVYRYVAPEFLDMANQRAAGNPKSHALVQNHGELEPMPRMPGLEGKEMVAHKVGPGLNVALDPATGYSREGRVLISMRLGDLIDNGGRIYLDTGASLSNLRALYITVPEGTSVPFTVVEPPAGGPSAK